MYIKLDHRRDFQYDVAEGKYEEGTAVVCFTDHCGPNQWFEINPDYTISPVKAPHFVLGFKDGIHPKLVKHGSPD